MKNKYNTLTAAFVLIAFVVGVAVSDVGREIENKPGECYTWRLPATLFCMMIIPLVLGYAAGREDKS